MYLFLRIILLLVSFFTLWYVVRKIRKSQIQIEDSVFWICFVLFIFVLGAIPSIGIVLSDMIGFESPANFVFLTVIFTLLIKCFFQSIQISKLESKIKLLSQNIALNRHDEAIYKKLLTLEE